MYLEVSESKKLNLRGWLCMRMYALVWAFREGSGKTVLYVTTGKPKEVKRGRMPYALLLTWLWRSYGTSTNSDPEPLRVT
jgi:hypothetical protein